MAGNLGYKTSFVIDATDAFDVKHPDGTIIPAREVMRNTWANLDGEFANVITTENALRTF